MPQQFLHCRFNVIGMLKLVRSRPLRWLLLAFTVESVPKLVTDREVYDWLTEHLDEGEKLPGFETWDRYVRQARSVLGTQKYEPRSGREHGGTIVREDQI